MGRISLSNLPFRVVILKVELPSSSSYTGGLLSSGPFILRRSKEVAMIIITKSADLH